MTRNSVSPQRQAEIDAGWTDLAAYLNASHGLRASRASFDAGSAAAPGARMFGAPAAAARPQSEIDASWAEVVAELNAAHGVRPPTAPHSSPGAPDASPRRQSEIDASYATIARQLNADHGARAKMPSVAAAGLSDPSATGRISLGAPDAAAQAKIAVICAKAKAKVSGVLARPGALAPPVPAAQLPSALAAMRPAPSISVAEPAYLVALRAHYAEIARFPPELRLT